MEEPLCLNLLHCVQAQSDRSSPHFLPSTERSPAVTDLHTSLSLDASASVRNSLEACWVGAGRGEEESELLPSTGMLAGGLMFMPPGTQG